MGLIWRSGRPPWGSGGKGRPALWADRPGGLYGLKIGFDSILFLSPNFLTFGMDFDFKNVVNIL
jgi:hypothetical protein